MVIVIIEIIKRSRCEEVDGGQLKWAVDKSKRNVKAMSRQLDEGNPYSSDKSKGRLSTHHNSTVAGHHCNCSERAYGGGGQMLWKSHQLAAGYLKYQWLQP